MNKTTMLFTGVLFLVVCALAVEVQPVINFIKQVEDTLKIIGLLTVCATITKVVEMVKTKLSK